MPETRRNKRKHLSGGVIADEQTVIRTTRLLIVNNALEAITLAGANLFSAPEWTVVCNSGEQDGGEKLFYKNMSKMGIYEYYYGYGTNNSVLKNLACKSWCLVATTNSELVPLIQDIFMQEPYTITVSDTMISAKLNRFKTVLVSQTEKHFQKDEQANQNGGQYGGVLPSDIVTSIQQTFVSQDKPEVFAEFLTRDMFTVKEILRKMNEKVNVKTEDGKTHEVYNSILYLPETTSNNSIRVLKSFLENPYSKQMDMLFFDSRPTPTIVEQYFYKIDLDEPIIIRTNSTTRKMIALLDSIDDLETLFSEGYQFLSSLRITPLNLLPIPQVPNQQGGDMNDLFAGMDDSEFQEMEISQNPFIALVNPTVDQTISVTEPLETPVTESVEPVVTEPLEPTEIEPPVPVVTEPQEPTETEPVAPVITEPLEATVSESPVAQQLGGKRRTRRQRKYKGQKK